MFVIHRLLLMLSQGGDEEVYFLLDEKAGNSGFPLLWGEREKGQEGERKLRKQ